MKILTITTLFPNAANPRHGVFIETRMREFCRRYPDAQVTVIAPVPWFPFRSEIFGRYATFANSPTVETRSGMTVYHPRYLVLPKFGMRLTASTLTHSILKAIHRLTNQGLEFDLIDGHYFFPDGVAIANVAKKCNKPFTVTARGSDINYIAKLKPARGAIQEVLHEADHNFAVCDALRNEMIKLGADPEQTTTLRNGVDLELFPFVDEVMQAQLRETLKLPQEQRIALSVGNLVELKGHDYVIRAIEHLPDTNLLIAGSGPLEASLMQLVQSIGLDKRVTFLGVLNQEQLASYYGAADVTVLASSREGWANVLLESMACGTPVVATNVGGTPEVVCSPEAGTLVDRSVQDISRGVREVVCSQYRRKNTRSYAELYSWQNTVEGMYRIFSKVIASNN